MKNYGTGYIRALWTVTILSLFAGGSGVGFGVYALRELSRVAVEEAPAAGGAEVDVEIPPPQPPGEYLFPIRKHDYKMLSDKFGYRISPILHIEKDHEGLDIVPAVVNAQVVAIADGIVVHHYLRPGTPHPDGGFYRGHDVYGCMVHIKHTEYVMNEDTGELERRFTGAESLYAHLSDSFVHEGQFIPAGKPIGRTGNTGKSVNEHLHIEIRVNGEKQNPLHYLPRVAP